MSPKVAGKEEKWKRGQFEYTIQEGENDLGDISPQSERVAVVFSFTW